PRRPDRLHPRQILEQPGPAIGQRRHSTHDLSQCPTSYLDRLRRPGGTRPVAHRTRSASIPFTSATRRSVGLFCDAHRDRNGPARVPATAAVGINGPFHIPEPTPPPRKAAATSRSAGSAPPCIRVSRSTSAPPSGAESIREYSMSSIRAGGVIIHVHEPKVTACRPTIAAATPTTAGPMADFLHSDDIPSRQLGRSAYPCCSSSICGLVDNDFSRPLRFRRTPQPVGLPTTSAARNDHRCTGRPVPIRGKPCPSPYARSRPCSPSARPP